MEQNNTQTQTQMVSDDKQKIRAKWFLRILLTITVIFIGYRMFTLLSDEDIRPIFTEVLKYKTDSLIMYAVLIGLAFVNFLPNIVVFVLYKKGKYLQQIIWGIVLFVVTQLIVIFFMESIFYPDYWPYDNQNQKPKEEIIPCVPGPGIYCNDL